MLIPGLILAFIDHVWAWNSSVMDVAEFGPIIDDCRFFLIDLVNGLFGSGFGRACVVLLWVRNRVGFS